jgi:ATP/maltotriose-dependent transcriptional regulator MalT
MSSLAKVLCCQGKYNEAEAMYCDALQLRETALGYDYPLTLTSMNSLADVLHSQGKYDEAQ